MAVTLTALGCLRPLSSRAFAKAQAAVGPLRQSLLVRSATINMAGRGAHGAGYQTPNRPPRPSIAARQKQSSVFIYLVFLLLRCALHGSVVVHRCDIYTYKNVFFGPSSFLSLPAGDRSSYSRLRRTQGARPDPLRTFGPWPMSVARTRGFKVACPLGEGFRARRAIPANANPRTFIINRLNDVRRRM